MSKTFRTNILSLSGKDMSVQTSDTASFWRHDGTFATPTGFITSGQTGQFYPNGQNPSGYITTGQTGAFGGSANTGILTGVFYPLNSNPSGYITPSQTGALTGVFYPLATNPSGYATTGNFLDIIGTGGITIITGQNVLYVSGSASSTGSNYYYINSGTGAYIFRSGISTGISEQFIAYPVILDSKPYVISTLHNDISNNVIPMQLSGVNSSGFWVIFSDIIDNTGYYLDTYASNSTNTGLATNVILNSVVSSPWTTLTWGNPLTWNTTTSQEDKAIINLTGSTTLSIVGLYNGWAGMLKVKQQFSGFSLTLPSGTKVVNGGSGIASLTTGISGAIDLLGFSYDGTDLMVGVGNNFN